LNIALKPFGIGSTEFVVLGNAVRLSQRDQSVTPAALMEMTKVDRMTASQTIRSLEKKGLVERVNFPDDRRTFSIMPTKTGAKLADDALGKVIEAHARFFAPLRQDTNQYLALTQKLIEENNDDGAA
jgi:DNA-binding MarR family transcriptional regulator